VVRVLVAENDPRDTAAVAAALRRHGFDVRTAGSVAAVLAGAGQVDLVVLGLPPAGADGLAACAAVRAATEAPIIGTMAADSGLDLVAALREGLDVCLVRPVGMRELAARVDAVLRRTLADGRQWDTVSCGPLRLNLRTREVFRCADPVQLTRREFDLLHLLAATPDEVFTRRHIMSAVWGDGWGQSDRTLDTHVSSLRNKLGDAGVITTIRGVGFRIGYRDVTAVALAGV
jgi:DNA-binding response OmpR family regulator